MHIYTVPVRELYYTLVKMEITGDKVLKDIVLEDLNIKNGNVTLYNVRVNNRINIINSLCKAYDLNALNINIYSSEVEFNRLHINRGRGEYIKLNGCKKVDIYHSYFVFNYNIGISSTDSNLNIVDSYFITNNYLLLLKSSRVDILGGCIKGNGRLYEADNESKLVISNVIMYDIEGEYVGNVINDKLIVDHIKTKSFQANMRIATDSDHIILKEDYMIYCYDNFTLEDDEHGRIIVLYNISNIPILILGNLADGNRALEPKQSVRLQYNGTLGLWYII